MKFARLLIASLFVILLVSHSISARLLSTNQGGSLESTQEEDILNQLMGLEECNKADDEECVKRRMVAEAHLDYIYTQRHKPKP